MDTLDRHFTISIFQNLNPQWWDRQKTASNKDKMFPALPRWLCRTVLSPLADGWHCFKTLMLISFIGSIMTYQNYCDWDILIYASLYFIVFELFYSRVLIK